MSLDRNSLPLDIRKNQELKNKVDDREKPFEVGERVFCTVTAIRQWCVVTAVKGPWNNQRIQVDAFSGWGYAHNFTRNPANWMLK